MNRLLIGFLGFFLALGANGLRASADEVSLSGSPEEQVIRLTGVWGGLSNEIYSILDLAGVQGTARTEGRTLQGKYLVASLDRFTPISYFTVSIQAEANTSESNIILTGAAAQELYEDMQKAGLPGRTAVDGSRFEGVHLSCKLLCLGHARYTCNLGD